MAPQNAWLLDRLRARLSVQAARALLLVLAVAARRKLALHLVGGGVRDLLMEAEHVDLDLVGEADVLGLAGEAARELNAKLVTHPRFGTAVLKGAGFRIDLARARAERYDRPGALPVVSPASLADDLARRDFTINAMALTLCGPGAGALLDPHGGRTDLEGQQVRVLHERSFQDDATRILRALRYAGRLGFRLERETKRLLRRALTYLRTISGARLRHELESIAREERAAQIVGAAQRLAALAAVHPALRATDRVARALGQLARVAPAHRDAVLFCLLLSGASAAEAEGAIERLALTGRQAEAVRAFLHLRDKRDALAAAHLRPSEAVAILGGDPLPAIEALALLADDDLLAERTRRYLDAWRLVRPRLDGHDIERLGVARGPLVGEALAALRAACLDGVVASREDEASFVRRRFVTGALTRTGHG
jgi:tRNA nucleotidyltransferase (CCA-adding enzyme)